MAKMASNEQNEQSWLLPTSQRDLQYDSLEPPAYYPKKKSLTQRGWVYAWCCAVLVALAALIGLNVWWVTQRSEELISKSVEVEIYNVSLAGVSTKGVDVRVHGMALVDYDSIESEYFKNVMRLGGGIFRSAAVKMDAVDLETDIDGEKVRIGSVDVPDMKVNIANGQSTPVDMVISIHPDTAKLLGLVKRILTHPEDLLKVYGTVALKIALGGIPIGRFDIDFEQIIKPNKYFEIDPEDVEIKNASLSPRDDTSGYDAAFLLAIPNPVKQKMISFQVPELHWNVFVNDCDGLPAIPVLDEAEVITSLPLKLSSLDETLSANITASVSQLNDKLNRPCKDGTSTPLGNAVREFMDNGTLSLRVQNIGGSDEYPSFLNEILMSNALDFTYHPTANGSQLIHNTSLDNLGFEFLDGDFGSPVISGEVNVFIELPFPGLEDSVSVKSARGVPQLYHEGINFGEVELNEWHSCENTFAYENGVSYLHAKIVLKQETVVITDAGVFATVVNEVLWGSGSKVLVKSDLDCIVQTLIGDLEIDGIYVENESDIKMGSLFRSQ